MSSYNLEHKPPPCSQCGNLKKIAASQFYVKSIVDSWEIVKSLFWIILRALLIYLNCFHVKYKLKWKILKFPHCVALTFFWANCKWWGGFYLKTPHLENVPHLAWRVKNLMIATTAVREEILDIHLFLPAERCWWYHKDCHKFMSDQIKNWKIQLNVWKNEK